MEKPIWVLCVWMVTVACGPIWHPDLCQGAVCGSEGEIRAWLQTYNHGSETEHDMHHSEVSMPKIPQQYVLPGNFKVKIREVSNEYFDGQGWGDSEAVWIWNEKTIFLRQGKTVTEKWEDLLHELEHAWIDAKEILRSKIK